MLAGLALLLAAAGRARHRRDPLPSSSSRTAPARRSPRRRPSSARAQHQARAAAGRARVRRGRRIGAQHRGHLQLQRHRDRHLRRHRRQPAAQRRVGLLRCHRRGGGRAEPPGRAAQEQRRRPVAQHRLRHLRQRAELLCRRLHAPDRRDRARGVPHPARHRPAAPQVHAGRRPEGPALQRGHQGVSRRHHAPQAQGRPLSSTGRTA